MFLVILSMGYGCSNPQNKIIEQQQKQISELNEKIDEFSNKLTNIPDNSTQNTTKFDPKKYGAIAISEPENIQNVTQYDTKTLDDLFEKKQSCMKYQETIKNQFGGQTSVTVFYSQLKNTCAYESISIKNGVIVSKIIADIFSPDFYVLEQGDELIYDKKIFGENKTYTEIEEMLKK